MGDGGEAADDPGVVPRPFLPDPDLPERPVPDDPPGPFLPDPDELGGG